MVKIKIQSSFSTPENNINLSFVCLNFLGQLSMKTFSKANPNLISFSLSLCFRS